MTKISIITPSYNSSKFIERTIKSVLGQTFTDWEYLIIDDNSTDDTIAIINKFIKKDSRIKLLTTPQNSGGPALPKNIGIDNAQGEYVAFLDHDDEWLPEKLEKQFNFFKNSKNKNLGIVACYLYIKDNNTKEIISNYDNLHRSDVLQNLFKINFIFTSSCVLTKLSILKKVGYFDTNFKIGDDWDMWVRIALSKYDFDFIPEYLINYFVHSKNAFYNSGLNNDHEFILFFNKYTELFIKYNTYLAGYCYFLKKEYRLSRKYFIKNISLKSIKSIGYIFLTFFPKFEKNARKIWGLVK